MHRRGTNSVNRKVPRNLWMHVLPFSLAGLKTSFNSMNFVATVKVADQSASEWANCGLLELNLRQLVTPIVWLSRIELTDLSEGTATSFFQKRHFSCCDSMHLSMRRCPATIFTSVDFVRADLLRHSTTSLCI